MIVGICDDESIYIERTKECCNRLGEELQMIIQYVIFRSGEEVLQYEDELDVLFLDVEMSGISGIEILKYIENSSTINDIYFISNHLNYVFDSFSEKTKGYLCKPIEYREFVDRVSKTFKFYANIKKIEVNYIGDKVDIYIRDIVYLKGADKYVKIFTKDKEYLGSGSIGNWQKGLQAEGFIRIHKSYLVNMRHISNMKDIVTISPFQKQLPIGRNYKNTCKEIYQKYIRKELRRERQ